MIMRKSKKYNGQESTVEIHSEYDNLFVTSIGQSAFEDCVTTIEKMYFRLANLVKYIENQVQLSKLMQITIILLLLRNK